MSLRSTVGRPRTYAPQTWRRSIFIPERISLRTPAASILPRIARARIQVVRVTARVCRSVPRRRRDPQLRFLMVSVWVVVTGARDTGIPGIVFTATAAPAGPNAVVPAISARQAAGLFVAAGRAALVAHRLEAVFDPFDWPEGAWRGVVGGRGAGFGERVERLEDRQWLAALFGVPEAVPGEAAVGEHEDE